jgi:hypothetical protein
LVYPLGKLAGAPSGASSGPFNGVQKSCHSARSAAAVGRQPRGDRLARLLRRPAGGALRQYPTGGAVTLADTTRITEHMPIVCSNSKQFGTVDKLEGDYIKLTKDDRGQHHWIPTAWVERVDNQVHVDRPGQQAMQEWQSTPPQGAGMRSR